MQDSRDEQRKAYLVRLAENLVKLGDEGFQALCKALGADYDQWSKLDIANRAIQWIEELDQMDMITALVIKAKASYPNFFWDDPNQVELLPPRKYYVASKLDNYTIRQEFQISGDRFKITWTPKDADYLIFDLDNPPDEWIKFLGTQEHIFKEGPFFINTIFVQRQSSTITPQIRLDGNIIFNILKELPPKDKNRQFNLVSTFDDLRRKLSELEDNRSTWEQVVDKQTNRQVIASLKS